MNDMRPEQLEQTDRKEDETGGIFKETKSLLKDIHTYNNDPRNRANNEEMRLVEEMFADAEIVEGNFVLCVESLNSKNRADCFVRVIKNILHIYCNLGNKSPQKGAKFDKSQTIISSKQLDSMKDRGKKATVIASSFLKHESNKEGTQVFESEYMIDLNEHYYRLVGDKESVYFQFIDYTTTPVFLYPKENVMQAMDRWAMIFKKSCININLYECFDIEEMMFHSPAFNVGKAEPDLQVRLEVLREELHAEDIQQEEVPGFQGPPSLPRTTSLRRSLSSGSSRDTGRGTSPTCTTSSRRTRPSCWCWSPCWSTPA